MAFAICLRPAESEEDILLIIRLALLDFLSDLSSPLDENELAVGGGESPFPTSRLEVDFLLLIDIGRWCAGDACTEGGRDGDLIPGVAIPGSRLIDLRRSENEVLRSLIMSLMIVIDDRRSFVVDLEAFERRLSLDNLLCWIVSLGAGGSTIAF
jgi:hypothetical protein